MRRGAATDRYRAESGSGPDPGEPGPASGDDEPEVGLRSGRRRRRMIARCLLSSKIPTLDDWCEEFGVSRPSIVKDVKAVREWLADRRLALVGKPGVGYSLVSQEFDLRNAVVQYLLQGGETRAGNWTQWPEAREVFGDFDWGPIQDFLRALQGDARMELAERDYLALAYYLAFSIVRLRAGKRVADDLGDLGSLVGTSEYRLVAGLVGPLEAAYGVGFPPAETAHLALSFICAKKVRPRTPSGLAAGDDEAELLAREVALDAEEVLGVPLSRDHEFLALLATHIDLTLRKLRYGLPIEDEGPTEEVKRQHPLAFGVGLKFLERLSQRLGKKAPLLEATYVAMHVAAGLEKVKYRLQRRKRVALVCTTALSASTLLFWQLTNLLPQVDVVQIGSWEDAASGRISSQVDLVVSTVALPPMDVPTVIISPLFTPEDRRKILAATQDKPEWDSVRRTAGELVEPEAVFLNRTYCDATACLEDIGRDLVRKGYAKRGFARALVERERRFGSALETPVPLAMPHAGPAFTRRATVGLVTLREPVSFRLVADPARELRVRLLVLPVLTLDDLTGLRFYELFAVLRRRRVAKAILGCGEPAEVIGLVEGSLRGHPELRVHSD